MRHVLRRLAQVVVVMLAATTLAFVALHLAPGDAGTALAEGTPPDVRARLRVVYGLDQPIPVQYVRWIRAFVQGDAWSISARRPVLEVLADTVPTTAVLVLPALVLSLAAGMGLGVWQATWAGRRRDRWSDRLLLLLYSVPEFWLGMGLVLLFASHWQLLPPNGVTRELHEYLGPVGRLRDRAAHLAMPLTSLSIVGIATVARFQRESMRLALAQPFVRTARAGGLSSSSVIVNTWRNALLPVVSLASVLVPAYLAGVVFVEQVFAWPGVGTMLIDAVNRRDYPLVAGAVVVGSAITALTAAAAELVQTWLDPRLQDGAVAMPDAMPDVTDPREFAA